MVPAATGAWWPHCVLCTLPVALHFIKHASASDTQSPAGSDIGKMQRPNYTDVGGNGGEYDIDTKHYFTGKDI